MKKPFLLLIALALVLAACGGSAGAVAATVDETEITVGDVEALMDPDGATVTKEQFAQFLNFEIQWQVVEDASETDYGVTATDEEITTEADRIFEVAKTEDEDRETFLSSRGITEEFLRNIAHQGLLDLAVREAIAEDVEAPTQERIDAEMEVATASLTQVCVSHILVETEPEAETVMGRLDEGEDFGELATEFSQDPGSAEDDGVLPCGSAGQYVDEFRDASLIAPIGEVYEEIVETQFGFHIVLVTDRVEPEESELPTEQELIDSITATTVGDAMNTWFMASIIAADVTVDEEYGTWQATPEPTVIAPSE